MKYLKLRNILNKMSLADLDKDVTVSFAEELYAVAGLSIADVETEDRVIEGTLIIFCGDGIPSLERINGHRRKHNAHLR